VAVHRHHPDCRWVPGRGPGDKPGAEISRWVGIIAAALGAISATFLVPYYPVWALLYIIVAIMVIYGLSAHYDDKTA
jgi:hypothetical protein